MNLRGMISLHIATIAFVAFLFLPASANAASSKAIVEKRYWKNDVAVTEQVNTYGPGDTVYASISVSLADDTEMSANIVDSLPKNALLPVLSRDLSKCHIPSAERTNFEYVGSELRWNAVTLTKTPKYYCYKFQIDIDIEAKNYLEQTEVRVESIASSNLTVGNENNYLMIVGAPWANSMGTPPETDAKLADGTYTSIESTITDKIVKNQVLLENKAGNDLTKFPGFSYITSTGKASRGGYFNSYPVKVTDKAGDTVLGAENYYLFYNPLYYLFGNVFSGGSSTTRAFDFNSRGSTIASKDGNTNKLNSEATLYDYDFDSNSLVYWDRTNVDKNKQMYENIKKYVTDPKPEVVCDISSRGKSVFASGNFSLNNKSCLTTGPADGGTLYPSGRVWYYKANPASDGANIDFNAVFRAKGTVIVDFADYSSGAVPQVNIKRNLLDTTYMGLIVVNGGNVLLGKNLEKYNGIIFVPGRL